MFFYSRVQQMNSIKTQDSLKNNSGNEFELYRSSIETKIPEISVVISTYNRSRAEIDCESLLQRALDSILNQTFTNFELILIDDCSTDGSKEFCKEIALRDPRVQFYHFKKNSGLPAKRYNFGISVSRGKYVTFMFDDDRLELNALEDLYLAIETQFNSCGMVYGQTTHYRGDDRKNVEILGDKWEWKKIQKFNFIGNNAVIVKKSAIDLVGGYDESPVFSRVCDWDLWWRIGRKFSVGRINKKVSFLYSELSDSILKTRTLDWDICKNRQKDQRILPLQVIQKEPLRCRIQSYCFDLYLDMSPKWEEFKQRLQAILPDFCYLVLRKGNAFLKKMTLLSANFIKSIIKE